MNLHEIWKIQTQAILWHSSCMKYILQDRLYGGVRRTGRNPDESVHIFCYCPAYNRPAGVCCDQPVHLCPIFFGFFFFLEAILLAFFWCIRFVFATNDRSTCLRHHLDPNARRNCTFLALILAILLGSVLVAACHYQYRFWNLTISLALKLSITISYRKILAPQKEKECRRIETVMTYLCGKSPPFFFLARSYGIKTARDVLKSYLLRKRRERRSKFWFGVLPTQLFDKGLV